MARLEYGGTPADVFTKIANDPTTADPTHTDLSAQANVTLTAWTARTGGTQLTSLLNMSNVAITVVTTDNIGRVRFQGPDGYTAGIWLEDPDGNRWLVNPTDVASRSTVGGNAYFMDLWDGTGTQPQAPAGLAANVKVVWLQPIAPLGGGRPYGKPGDRWQTSA